MPADFSVRVEALTEFLSAVRSYRVEQVAALRKIRREIEEAHAFLDKAERAWELRLDDAERGLDECLQAAAAGHPADCSGYEREVDWCRDRRNDVQYWRRELHDAEVYFLPHADRLDYRLTWEFPRLESFLSGLVGALQRAANRRIRA